ncbi:uncharacterized protein LOC120345161 [Styela clava]
MKTFFYLTIIFLLLRLQYKYAFCQRNVISTEENSYTVCQNFKGIFDPSKQNLHSKVVQGIPGKRGPKGDKGSLGNIEESVIVQNLSEELKTFKNCDGLYRAGICYFLLEEKVSYENAVSKCELHGGHLASITSRQLYGALFRFVYDGFVLWQSSTYAQFWIDGTYSNANGLVTLRDTNKSPYILWYPGYPRPTEGHVYMAFEVKKSFSGNQNMFNINPAHRIYSLCQKS